MRLGEFIKMGYAAGVSQLPVAFKKFKASVTQQIADLNQDFIDFQNSVGALTNIKSANVTHNVSNTTDLATKLNESSGYVWANSAASVTINIAAGRYTSQGLYLWGKNREITIKGAAPQNRLFTAAATRGGSSGAWTYTGTFSTAGIAANFQVNDIVGVEGDGFCGAWRVSAVDTGTNSITITSTSQFASMPATGPTAVREFPTQFYTSSYPFLQVGMAGSVVVEDLAFRSGQPLGVFQGSHLMLGNCAFHTPGYTGVTMSEQSRVTIKNSKRVFSIGTLFDSMHYSDVYCDGYLFLATQDSWDYAIKGSNGARFFFASNPPIKAQGHSSSCLFYLGGVASACHMRYPPSVSGMKLFEANGSNDMQCIAVMKTPTLLDGATRNYTANTPDARGNVIYEYAA